MDKYFHPTQYNGCSYLSMLGLKLNHVSKRGPWTEISHIVILTSNTKLYVEFYPTRMCSQFARFLYNISVIFDYNVTFHVVLVPICIIHLQSKYILSIFSIYVYNGISHVSAFYSLFHCDPCHFINHEYMELIDACIFLLLILGASNICG